MKRGTRILCLLLALTLLVGCAPSGANNGSTASPEPSGEVLATEPTEAAEPKEAIKTKQAIERVRNMERDKILALNRKLYMK